MNNNKLKCSIPLENRILLKTQIFSSIIFTQFKLDFYSLGHSCIVTLDSMVEVLGGCQIFFWLRDVQGILK